MTGFPLTYARRTAAHRRPGSWMRVARRTLAAALAVACATIAPGCRTAFAPTMETPAAPLQWPFAPAPARLTYGWSLTGIAPRPSVASVLGNILTGATTGDGGFALPVAITTGSGGRVAVADTGCACVHLWLPSSQAALRLTGDGRERMKTPVAVAFDDRDRLFVSDSSGVLFGFEADGTPRLAVRSAGSTRLERPTGLAWAPDRGLLYVVDTLAHRVHALDGDAALRFSFGGRGAGEGQLNFPTHIARSPSGELYVADAMNFRIAIFDAGGRPAGSFGRHGDGTGDIAMPKGIAAGSDGVVYVVDAMFDNVQLFRPSGEFLLTLGERGTGFGQFWLPAGAWLAPDGKLYVCDTYNHRVQVFHVEGGHAQAKS